MKIKKFIIIVSIILILIFAGLIIFSSCFKKAKPIKLKNSFSVSLGYDINEIGNFFESNRMSADSLFIHYNEGFYYFSDPINKKIMKITKSGVPILIIFNKTNNPHIKPTITSDQTSDESLSFVKLYKDYPLNSPGIIATDIDKNIYLVDNDNNKNTNGNQEIYTYSVLKFDKKGNLLFKLGREGINTEPFDSIVSMLCDSDNNLVIQDYSNKNILIYKFSKEGKFLSKTEITKNQIPLTSKEADSIVDIIDVKLGFNEDDVYVTCQYINKNVENISLANYEILYEKILKYSLKSKKFTQQILKIDPEYFDITRFKQTETAQKVFGNKKKILKPMQSLIGVDKYNNVYMTRPEFKIDKLNKLSQFIFVYDSNHRLKNYFSVEYPQGVDYYSDFYLSAEGKIFSYFFNNGDLQFVDIYQ